MLQDALWNMEKKKKMKKKLVPILTHFQFGNENLKLLSLCVQPKNWLEDYL